MAKLERDYEKSFEQMEAKICAVMEECLGNQSSMMEYSLCERAGVKVGVWTGSCIYFGGRVASLSAVLTGDQETCHLVVQSTPGVGAAAVEYKVIRKFSEKLSVGEVLSGE